MAAFRLRIVAYALLASVLTGTAAELQARNCTPQEKKSADKQLWLSKADKQKSLERNLPWGLPESPTGAVDEMLLVQRDYVIDYDKVLRVPVWSAERLDGKGLGKVSRVDCFRRDPRIDAADASLPSDYREPIFDQGHLTPNGDMSKALIPVLNSFIMSNMAPQFCQFNRGVWQIFESLVRLWAQEEGTVYVITGSVFDWNDDGERDADAAVKRMKSNNGKDRVAIPSAFYKILVHQNADGSVQALAVILPNDQTDLNGAEAIHYLAEHIRSIDEIQAVTGLTFFPDIGPDGASVKHTRAAGLWPYQGTPARSLVDAKCRKTAEMPY